MRLPPCFFLLLLYLLTYVEFGTAASIFKQRAQQRAAILSATTVHNLETDAVKTKASNFPALYASLGRPPLTLNNAISIIQKVEAAYPSLSVVQLTDSLRRLAGYDGANFRTLLGTSGPATQITPTGALTQADIDTLMLMIQHDVVGGVEFGVATHGSTAIALGHVICGISAGHHRSRSVSMHWANNIGVGAFVDNLYSITLAGDLGQTAVFKYAGRQTTYIGPNTDATYPELIGDIDGLLIGGGISHFSGKKVSEILTMYYVSPPATLTIKASQRIDLLGAESSTYILDQAIAFADNYKYTIYTLPRNVDQDVINAFAAARVWAAAQAPISISQLRTMLTSEGGVYVHRAVGATPLYYRSTASSWEWSVDNRNWQDVSSGHVWRGSLPGNVRSGDHTPVLNNIRIINFLQANPGTRL